MKAYLRKQIEGADTPLLGQHIVREYLQARILEGLQHLGAMVPLAFQGGTALRFLFDLPRYSEDLDFTLERNVEQYDFRKYLNKISREFEKEGYGVGMKVNDNNVVHAAFIRFPGLLYELGLSPHRNQVFAVKLEVDTNPPQGAGLETTITRRHVTLQIQHHDRPSLLAGKLHALLQRAYTKGRDVYDLFWYLSNRDWPEPNLRLLNHALKQTDWEGEKMTAGNWRGVVRSKLEQLSWDSVVEDVEPFLEKQAQVELLTRENLLSLLEK
jgi:hypothetical protein